jgi:DNA-binding transcriptional ArsR family regulator
MPRKPLSRRGPSSLGRLCRVLAHDARRQILHLLGEEALDVSTIAHRARLAPDATSHHLARLYDLGLVGIEPRGKRRLYHLTKMVNVRRAAGFATLTLRAPDGTTVSLRSKT